MRTQTAEFCSTCHKVHLDVPVNHYRWMRGFNDYDNWQASGVSWQGARSFYYPAKAQACADCHMPLENSTDAGDVAGAVHSHRFPAANTALPYVNDDANATRRHQKIPHRQGTQRRYFRDIARIVHKSAAAGRRRPPAAAPSTPGIETTFAVGEESAASIPSASGSESAAAINELTAPLDRLDASVRRGERLSRRCRRPHAQDRPLFPRRHRGRVSIAGSNCPPWTTKVTQFSGAAAPRTNGKGPVDPGAHFYRSLQIDSHGNPINKRNAWATRAAVYVHSDSARRRRHRSLSAANSARTQAIAFTSTQNCNYRKFSWWNTQFSFAGIPARQTRPANSAVRPTIMTIAFALHRRYPRTSREDQGDSRSADRRHGAERADLSVLPANARNPRQTPV